MIIATEDFHYADQDYIRRIIGVFDTIDIARAEVRKKYDTNPELTYINEYASSIVYNTLHNDGVIINFESFKLNVCT